MFKNTAFVALASLALLTACNSELTGTINIEKPMKVIVNVSNNGSCETGCGPTTEERVLSAGQFKAELEPRSDRELILKIDQNGANEISMNVPSGNPIPEVSGNFQISAVQSGQPFDTAGVINSVVQDSERRHEWEGCTYTRQEEICDHVPNHGVVCHIRTITYSGQREVEYFVRNTAKSVNVSFLQPGTSEKIASFTGNRNDSERHYLFQGVCY